MDSRDPDINMLAATRKKHPYVYIASLLQWAWTLIFSSLLWIVVNELIVKICFSVEWTCMPTYLESTGIYTERTGEVTGTRCGGY